MQISNNSPLIITNTLMSNSLISLLVKLFMQFNNLLYSYLSPKTLDPHFQIPFHWTSHILDLAPYLWPQIEFPYFSSLPTFPLVQGQDHSLTHQALEPPLTSPSMSSPTAN